MPEKKLRKVWIEADVKDLVSKYCIINGLKMQSYLSRLVEVDLAEFKKELEKMRELK